MKNLTLTSIQRYDKDKEGKPVPFGDYSYLYSVNQNGDVWSVRRKKFLRQKTNRSGYKWVRLANNTKVFSITTHRLVALTYLPLGSEKKEINHKNGIKSDNRVENLEWCSRSENMKHAHKEGIINALKGVKHGMAKLNEEQVKEIRSSLGVSHVSLAKRFGVSNRMVGLIIKGVNWKHI